MKFDDASWHYGGDFPKDLPESAGGTHIGIFVCWAILRGLAADIHIEDFPEMLDKLRTRTMSPGAWFLAACDEKFTDEDLNAEGNAFAASYYDSNSGPVCYLADYAHTFSEHEDLYFVPDTWVSFERLSPVLDRRFDEWKSRH